MQMFLDLENEKFFQEEWTLDGRMADWTQSSTLQEVQRTQSCETGEFRKNILLWWFSLEPFFIINSFVFNYQLLCRVFKY